MAKQISFEFDDLPADSGKEQQAARDHTRVSKIHLDPVKNEVQKKSRGGRRSLKDPVDTSIVLPPDEVLFQKTYYPIGEVATMFGEQTSLIRYWANEFKVLKPRKNRKGDRYFRPEDVKSLYLIHHLLRVRKFTIEGAREFLKHEKLASEKYEVLESLKKLKLFLQQLKDNL